MPRKLAWAKEFGATACINPQEVSDVPDAIRSLTDGVGVDYAFEVIGVPAVITQAFLSTRRGGKAIIVGVPGFGQDVSIPGSILALEERGVVGSLYGSANMRRDIPRLVDLYMNRKLKIDELISRRITLDEVNDAFTAMEQGEVARSVIMYS